MINLKGHKGITLIALVITIIVLLILAGITIAQITGQDSAPEKATEAKRKNDEGAEFDAIKVAVVGAVANGNNGLVDAESLKNELNGLVKDEGRLAIRSDNAPWRVVGKTGIKYIINENGIVTIDEPVATVEFNSTTDSIGVGKSKKLAITCRGASGNVTAANEVIFTSSNTSIATVQEDGSIKIANNATIGTTVTITVVADGIVGSNSCEITTEENIVEIGEPINANKYGYKVNGYISKAENSGETIGWRLFYQDTENTYIISDVLIGSYKPIDYCLPYRGANISAEGKGLNPLIKDLIISQSNNLNMKATSWFTDTSENGPWDKYKDSEGKAIFSIASPTLELYTKSYNAVAELNDEDSINIITYPSKGTYGYAKKDWPTAIDDTVATHNIYSKKTNTLWWLASPGDYGDNGSGDQISCFWVDKNRYRTYYVNMGPSVAAIRPIVCIPTVVFESLYTLEND